ncbi:dolichyl-diphosphooligosaccharide--protein glycosyltransferase subunit 1-like [Sycon ciliatum]|uniref:dolichyl-diphosphooligosaccharide--protein glycosyltransferase subunit 1-like n=1 Tax=Sycon ciliatum TaxID=27933 RepID=UPI0020AC9666|eukprot:scpid75189/ scgid18252/ Dolichyl-diphosphooligosaccharide--protein glycosyltransferase subunit 1; Dolichyl-diphosphooligosaccharide--protein glycosyltransferase 67 kDa subunit; Ribophorin I; Ribophorin-1
MMREQLFALLLLAAGCLARNNGVSSNLVNREITRHIDLKTQVAHISYEYVIENTGSSAVPNFLFALESHHGKQLSFLGATDDEKNSLKVTENVEVQPSSNAYFARIAFASPLAAGAKTTVTVSAVIPAIVTPFPAEITQSEKQLVRYSGNHYVLSPYATDSQTTSVELANKNVESMSRLQPVNVNEAKIKYGPYENVAAMASDELSLHYENNAPYLSIRDLDRKIEISHWGNVAVEETIDMVHAGAKLKGSFSRLDFQRNPAQAAQAAVLHFKTILPATARDVYYRDEIGNISTSHMLEKEDSVELDIRPRFPLFGGWKTHYYTGYNVPSHEYLERYGSQYRLTMRAVDHVYDDQHVQKLTVRVILPEGAKNIKVETPYTMEQGPQTLHYTYLDTFGRPVVTLAANNLVQDHIQDFVLTYEFDSTIMLQEPLLVVGALYLLFLVVIVYVRLDFSLKPKQA